MRLLYDHETEKSGRGHYYDDSEDYSTPRKRGRGSKNNKRGRKASASRRRP